jgi:hypothetical protein
MQYLLLLALPADADDRPDAPAPEDWGAYTTALQEAGILVTGAGLEAAHTATTVQVRDGERLLTDGPFAETKEHLLGFYVIDVPDLDAALSWAARVPNARIGSVEVRPVKAASQARAMAST